MNHCSLSFIPQNQPTATGETAHIRSSAPRLGVIRGEHTEAFSHRERGWGGENKGHRQPFLTTWERGPRREDAKAEKELTMGGTVWMGAGTQMGLSAAAAGSQRTMAEAGPSALRRVGTPTVQCLDFPILLDKDRATTL